MALRAVEREVTPEQALAVLSDYVKAPRALDDPWLERVSKLPQEAQEELDLLITKYEQEAEKKKGLPKDGREHK